MAQQTIGIGSAANDGTGDPIRDAFDKCNDNFTELYTGLVGLLDFKGSTDCSANPNYPAASKGDFYVVSVAGKIGGASGTVVEIGDGYFALADNAGGTQASVGASWTVIQANIVGGTINSLDDIPDVNVPSPSDGDVLAWDNGAGEWVPVPQVGGGVGGTVPDGGTDGQVLTKQSGVDQDVDWEDLPSRNYRLTSITTTTGTPANTTETDLLSYTLPAGTLATNGQAVRIVAAGTWAATSRTRTTRLYFGSTVIATVSSANSANVRWRVEATVIRVDATNQRVSSRIAIGTTTGESAIIDILSPTETLSGALSMKVTGQSSGAAVANDVVGNLYTAEFLP